MLRVLNNTTHNYIFVRCLITNTYTMDKIVFTSISIEELANILADKISIINNQALTSAYYSKEVEVEKTEYLTREETAKLCKINSLSTLWNWKQKGKLIPLQKAGRKPLYLRQDVLNFLNRKEAYND